MIIEENLQRKHPDSYEIIKHPNYKGLKCPTSFFFPLTKDPLYKFPIIDTQNIESEARAIISAELLTFTQSINVTQTLYSINASNPYKRTLDFEDILEIQMSNEAL